MGSCLADSFCQGRPDPSPCASHQNGLALVMAMHKCGRGFLAGLRKPFGCQIVHGNKLFGSRKIRYTQSRHGDEVPVQRTLAEAVFSSGNVCLVNCFLSTIPAPSLM